MFPILAIGCGRPNVANSEFDEEALTAIRSVVQLKCKDSFRWSGKADEIECEESGEWKTIPDCKGDFVDNDSLANMLNTITNKEKYFL